MYKIIKKEFDFYGEQRGSDEVVKVVCSIHEANRLLEVCYRGDSFTKYEVIKK